MTMEAWLHGSYGGKKPTLTVECGNAAAILDCVYV